MATPDSFQSRQEKGRTPAAPSRSAATTVTFPMAVDATRSDSARSPGRKNLNLKTKATLLAIAIGTLPVVLTGSLAYFLTSPQIKQQVISKQEARAYEAANLITPFMFERYGDIQVLAKLPLFKQGAKAISKAEGQAVLDSYVKIYGVYDSVAAFDLNGNLLYQSTGNPLSNHKDRAYFQEVLKTQKPFISQPEFSKSSQELVVHFAAPIFNEATGKMVGIIRSRMPTQYIARLIEGDTGEQGEQSNRKLEEVLVADSTGKYFIAKDQDEIGLQAEKDYAIFPQLKSRQKITTGVNTDANANLEELVSYSPSIRREGLPDLNWSFLISTETKDSFAVLNELRFALIGGTGLAAVLVGLLATYIANRATRPIIDSAEAVKKIGRGELETRVKVNGEDELADLGNNINQMAAQIQNLLTQQETAALAQMTAQSEIARQQQENALQERQRSEALQQELMTLLDDVGGASEGDLTVRAAVSAGEIGIVADFFNSIVESLRGIVAQVKVASAQVNTSIGSNEVVMGQLAQEAQSQAVQITDTLKSVEQMAISIQQVSENAQQAADVAQMASLTAVNGGKTMDRTVESIVELRETVAETAQQVKRLGESSKKISKAVTLINQISLQTNVLAVNASIEAARAGEEGQGFAVVAEEVAALAAQSANATKEIEQIVRTIQSETSSVVKAMERGTTQVDKGTQQVEEAKESLQQIVQVSRQIDKLLQSISSATVSQTETSEVVKLLMAQINHSSERTSEKSRQVSSALQETVEIAKQLQSSVGTFKVEADRR